MNDHDIQEAGGNPECAQHGHDFDGYDTISQICVVCGLIREYPIRESQSRLMEAGDDLHTCRGAGDHAFGFNGGCNYCGKAEHDLTEAEHEQRRVVQQNRKDGLR